jgi:hypothetical protein
MSSPEKNFEEKDQWDRLLSHQLQHWVDEHPSPDDGRKRLLHEASIKPPSSSTPDREHSLPRILYRRVARLLPRREQVPFSTEDFVHSVTISSPLVHGLIYCV